jgi:hypothetical protein
MTFLHAIRFGCCSRRTPPAATARPGVPLGPPPAPALAARSRDRRVRRRSASAAAARRTAAVEIVIAAAARGRFVEPSAGPLRAARRGLSARPGARRRGAKAPEPKRQHLEERLFFGAQAALPASPWPLNPLALRADPAREFEPFVAGSRGREGRRERHRRCRARALVRPSGWIATRGSPRSPSPPGARRRVPIASAGGEEAAGPRRGSDAARRGCLSGASGFAGLRGRECRRAHRAARGWRRDHAFRAGAALAD